MTREAPKQPPQIAKNRQRRQRAKSEAVREQAILALLEAKTIAEAARRCGVGERTLQRWLAEDPHFQQEYETARRVTFQAALYRVQALMGRAVTVLDDLLANTATPMAQLGAVRLISELALHERDAQTILRKLNEIEQAQRSR